MWGREPDYITAKYTTEDGQERSSLLLCSGWWSLSRWVMTHIHSNKQLSLSYISFFLFSTDISTTSPKWRRPSCGACPRSSPTPCLTSTPSICPFCLLIAPGVMMLAAPTSTRSTGLLTARRFPPRSSPECSKRGWTWRMFTFTLSHYVVV